jgi:hypothetical protein
VDKIRSFEQYRRNLTAPEVITYDELYARAEWLAQVSVEEAGATGADEPNLGSESRVAAWTDAERF